MDVDNFRDSFDGLFDDNAGRDWIVTKRFPGKAKVARCAEDEIDDLYMTRKDWLVKDEQKFVRYQNAPGRPPKWQLFGTAMFFIRDLLNCETKDGYFICKNIPFIGVLICGTVISLSIRFDKYAIVVDDGTSSIMCLIKQEELKAMHLDEEQKQRHTDLTEALKASPKDPVLRGKAIMMRALKNLVKNTPTFEDMKLGEIVTIIGTLSEYKDLRYIFIKSIEREPDDSLAHMKHLEQVLDLYTNVYDQEK